jgi:AcrR family transcriptional regulator
MSKVTSKRAAEPGARERNKLDKRERIAAAAWELFARDGFEATTTAAVAERAGVGKGTLFLYAPDKDDLLMLVMHDRLADRTDRAFATLSARAALPEQLSHVFVSLYELYAEQPRGIGIAFVRLVSTARGPNADRVHAMTQATLSRIASLVRTAQERGEVADDVLPMVAAANLFAAYFFVLFGWLSGLSPTIEILRSHLDTMIALQMRGLAKPHGKPSKS